jgi:hypothetical protein
VIIIRADGTAVELRSGRTPFELFFLIVCVLSGGNGLVNPHGGSNIVNTLLPGWEVWVWYSGLALGGAVGLAGVLAKGIASLLVERVALAILASLTLTYSAAVAVQVGERGAFVALIVASFTAGCIARILMIQHDLKKAASPNHPARPDCGGGT